MQRSLCSWGRNVEERIHRTTRVDVADILCTVNWVLGAKVVACCHDDAKLVQLNQILSHTHNGSCGVDVADILCTVACPGYRGDPFARTVVGVG
jgi:hypothetical protein